MPSALRLACLAFAIAASAAPPLRADGPLSLMFGTPEAEHATLTFQGDTASPEAIVIETRLVGAAGSRFALSVDRANSPLYERLLTPEDCRFVDQASTCRLAIAGNTLEYAAIVAAFKAGLTAHIQVETAGTMEMSKDLSLKGFTRAYNSL